MTCAPHATTPPLSGSAVRSPGTASDLGENGFKHSAPRVVAAVQVDGRRVETVERVVVSVGLTLQGKDSEIHDFATFEARMERFAQTLETRFGYDVTDVVCQRRTGKRPWAEIACVTPAFHLPRPGRLAQGPCQN